MKDLRVTLTLGLVSFISIPNIFLSDKGVTKREGGGGGVQAHLISKSNGNIIGDPKTES